MRTLNLENPVFKIPRKPPQMDPALYMVIKHYYDKTTAWRKLILMIGGFPENLRTLKEVLQSIYKEDSIVFDYRSKSPKDLSEIYHVGEKIRKRIEIKFSAILRCSKIEQKPGWYDEGQALFENEYKYMEKNDGIHSDDFISYLKEYQKMKKEKKEKKNRQTFKKKKEKKDKLRRTKKRRRRHKKDAQTKKHEKKVKRRKKVKRTFIPDKFPKETEEIHIYKGKDGEIAKIFKVNRKKKRHIIEEEEVTQTKISLSPGLRKKEIECLSRDLPSLMFYRPQELPLCLEDYNVTIIPSNKTHKIAYDTLDIISEQLPEMGREYIYEIAESYEHINTFNQYYYEILLEKFKRGSYSPRRSLRKKKDDLYIDTSSPVSEKRPNKPKPKPKLIVVMDPKDSVVIGGLLYRVHFPAYAEIMLMAVDNERKAKGVGSLLIDVLKTLLPLHVKSILVESDDRCIPFYEKNGFSKDVTWGPYYTTGVIIKTIRSTLMECTMMNDFCKNLYTRK